MIVRDVGVLQCNDAGIVVVVTVVVEGATDVEGAVVVDGTVIGTGTVVVIGAPTCGTSNAEYARKFGLPAPILKSAPVVALAMSSCSTCC